MALLLTIQSVHVQLLQISGSETRGRNTRPSKVERAARRGRKDATENKFGKPIIPQKRRILGWCLQRAFEQQVRRISRRTAKREYQQERRGKQEGGTSTSSTPWRQNALASFYPNSENRVPKIEWMEWVYEGLGLFSSSIHGKWVCEACTSCIFSCIWCGYVHYIVCFERNGQSIRARSCMDMGNTCGQRCTIWRQGNRERNWEGNEARARNRSLQDNGRRSQRCHRWWQQLEVWRLGGKRRAAEKAGVERATRVTRCARQEWGENCWRPQVMPPPILPFQSSNLTSPPALAQI